MANKLFKSLFAVIMTMGSVLGFVSCEVVGDDVVADPTVEVSTASMNFSMEEGSQTVDITANSDWKVDVDVDWVTVTPANGTGDAKITVAVAMNDTDVVRETIVKVIALHKTYGNWETKKIKVVQSASNDAPVEEELLYSDNFDGKEATKEYGNSNSSWPYIDQFPEFANPEGPAAENVTYSGSGVSVRANSTSNSSYSDYAGSGSNNIFFGGGAYFQVNDIALDAAQLNYKMTFGSEKYTQDGDSTFKPEEFIVSISKNGTEWAPLEYTFAGTEPGRWNVATVNFTLAAGTDKLYIKFEAKVASVYRLDDVKFFVGNGGQTIDLDNIEVIVPEPPTTDALYFENFDGQAAQKDGNYWPYVTDFPEMKNAVGPAAANVSYDGHNTTVRNNSNSDGSYSDYAGSGVNNIFFGKVENHFTIKDLALESSQKDLVLTFGTEKYSQSLGSLFTPSEFIVSLSADGEKWSNVEYTFAGTAEGRWNVATANFTLKEVPAKLYIKFSATAESAYRLDDVTLNVGEGGQTIDLAAGTENPTPEPEPNPDDTYTIAEAIAAADNTDVVIENATVIGIYGRGALLEDATGRILAYSGSPVDVVVGDVVKVEGTMSTYGGLRQIGGTVTFTKSGTTSYTYPSPKAMDGAAFDAYLSNPVIEYVEYTGTLAISGYYYNVTIDGAATAVGSLAYVIDGTVDPALDGKDIRVKGWTIGFSGGKYVNTMIASVVDANSTTPEPEPEPEPTPDGITPIADVLALGEGATIDAVIQGVVVSNYELNNLTSKKGMYVQDSTGALQFYLAANHEFAFGTKVQIDLTGATLGSYNGAVQVSGLGLDKITVVSTGNAVTPKTVTMADFLANKYEGQYIALEGVQVADADLSKTWVMGGAHTSIKVEDANGNNFVVFSSKYATYGTSTVAQGAGTIKGISSINNGNMQIIFAQNSDYAGLTGARFGEGGGDEPVNPEPEQPTGGSATISFADKANRTSYSETQQVWEQNGIVVTNNKGASTSNVGDYANPARFYKSSEVIIEAPGKIHSISVNCEGLDAKYVSPWGGTVVDGIVTISLDGTSESYTITPLSAQARAYSITITYAE